LRHHQNVYAAVASARPRIRAFEPGEAAKRAFDIGLAVALLLLIAPIILMIVVAIKIDSPGPVLFRARRVGLRGTEFAMLKFRKMYDGAVGPALTAADDARFTRVGRFLAQTKLDEIPQLVNVLMGEMSLVGPRPEDPSFIELAPDRYRAILGVRPGITGLSQLAFARESEVLDPADRTGHYVRAIFPQKLVLDTLYATSRSMRMDLAILNWTLVAVVARRHVAVNRMSGRLTHRNRRVVYNEPAVNASEAA
jgi:lipopolysaccharide/colanic/teichoic acid biosynthesis glycosyltransferase